MAWVVRIARRARTSVVVVPWDRMMDAVSGMDADREAAETRLCSYRVVATENANGEIRLDAEDAFPVGTSLERENRGPNGRGSWGGSGAAPADRRHVRRLVGHA